MLPRDESILEHITEYCESIEEARNRFGDNKADFLSDKAYHDLVCFYLLQIGELSNQLSTQLRAEYSYKMEWGQIKGMRNIVAHHYGSIDLTIVWNTVIYDIPKLKAFCCECLSQR